MVGKHNLTGFLDSSINFRFQTASIMDIFGRINWLVQPVSRRDIEERNSNIICDEILPGIPDDVFQKNIWKRLMDSFNLSAETGYFTVITLNEFIAMRAVNRRWRILTDNTYLMGVIKISVNDFGCYKEKETEIFPKDYIPEKLISYTIFNFYSKFPKLKCFGKMSSSTRTDFIFEFDSLTPLKNGNSQLILTD